MRTLVIIPTYNEIENIETLVRTVLSQYGERLEILVVDDGSPDGTGLKIEELQKEFKGLHLLKRQKKMGLGTAYVAGFRWAFDQKPEIEAMIEMDADFSHHPKFLEDMLGALQSKDFVIGSRYVSGGGTVNWGIGRKILSRGGSFYSRMILGAPIRDFTGGFNGWHRKVLQNVNLETLRSDGYSFQIELKYRAFLKGFSWVEFPIVFEDRKVGRSKMHRRIVIEALQRVWGFRFRSHQFLSG